MIIINRKPNLLFQNQFPFQPQVIKTQTKTARLRLCHDCSGCRFKVKNMSKRISVRIRDPNPLFRSWISNWATVAENEDKDQLATSLRRALLSLEKYPLKLNTGKDCLILDGFGANICEKLDAKLTQYQNRLANPSPLLERNKSPVALPPIPNVTNQAPKVPVSISQSQDKPSSSTEPKKRIRKTKSEQTLPKIPSKPSDEVLGTSTTNAAVGTKRKATTTIDSVIAEEVIMVRGTFEIILLVDSMETVGLVFLTATNYI